MKMIYEKPPILDLILASGMVPNIETTCFTFGDTLYNPGKKEVPDDFMVHEETHAAQQNHSEKDAERWWGRYIQDPYFRIQQEAEAFAVQYMYFKHNMNRDRNAAARRLFQLSMQLASPTYGSVMGQSAALRLIQSEAAKIKIPHR